MDAVDLLILFTLLRNYIQNGTNILTDHFYRIFMFFSIFTVFEMINSALANN